MRDKTKHNAYMREYMKRYLAEMSPERRAEWNARRNASARRLRANNPEVRQREYKKVRRSLEKRLAAMTPKEFDQYKAAKWAYEQKRLKDPKANASRLTSSRRWQTKWYWENPKRARDNQKQYRQRLKEETFAAYGGICVCCGESEIEFLSIDHIEPVLRKDRTRQGSALYQKLRKADFPAGFQVLCFNCNLAKRTHPVCPHKSHYLKLVTAAEEPVVGLQRRRK